MPCFCVVSFISVPIRRGVCSLTRTRPSRRSAAMSSISSGDSKVALSYRVDWVDACAPAPEVAVTATSRSREATAARLDPGTRFNSRHSVFLTLLATTLGTGRVAWITHIALAPETCSIPATVAPRKCFTIALHRSGESTCTRKVPIPV